MLTLVMSVVVGTVVSYASGLDLNYTVGAAFLGSMALGAAKVFLPAILFEVVINTAYAGEVLAKLLVKATTGNELVEGGHIRLEPNVNDKLYLPRLKTGKMLQKRKQQPKSEDSKGDFETDEKCLEPQDFMAYTEFNPRAFEKFWKPFQPNGELVFRELPTHVQNQLLEELAKVVDFEMGYHFINGELGATDDKLFNGVLYRIINDPDTIKVINNLVPLTRSNIITNGFAAVKARIPKHMRKSKNLKFFCSIEDFDLYDEAITLQASKGVNHTDVTPERYKKIPIVPLADWPKDVIVATIASKDMDSNLWAGVAHVNDVNAIKIDKVTNSGELYFFKMLMKADTQIAWGEQAVLFDGRSSETDITGFVLPEQTGAATINAGAHTVAIEVANGTDVTTLTATISLSAGATIDPGTGVELDYTNPVQFTVTASDGTEQVWTVTVTVAA